MKHALHCRKDGSETLPQNLQVFVDFALLPFPSLDFQFCLFSAFFKDYCGSEGSAMLEHKSLTFHLCAFILALAVLWLLLMLAALTLSTEGLELHWMLGWLDSTFVQSISPDCANSNYRSIGFWSDCTDLSATDCWVSLSLVSNIAFFFIFPFAFLYEEAEGICSAPSAPLVSQWSVWSGALSVGVWSSRSFLSCVLETTLVQSLITVLLHGSLALLQSFLNLSFPLLDVYASGFAFQIPGLGVYLCTIYRILSTCQCHWFCSHISEKYCLIVFGFPGMKRLIQSSVESVVPWSIAGSFSDEITCLHLELEYIKLLQARRKPLRT